MDGVDAFSVNDYTAQPASSMSSLAAPPREKTKRPQLSCNPCRARKVKCDRIQPCTACSLHQIAEICQYDLSEAERQPILQAEALKEKDKAIAHLQREISALRGEQVKCEPNDDDGRGPNGRKIRLPPKSLKRPLAEEEQPFRQGSLEANPFLEPPPGVGHVADEFSHLSFSKFASSLSTPDRRTDFFALPLANSHPFPTFWSAKDDTGSLIRLLPPEEDLYFYIDAFQHRVRAWHYPYIPEESTHDGVQKFLENVQHNAALHPDQLALLFATLAVGLQNGVYDRCGERWVAGSVEAEAKKGDIYVAAVMQCLRISSFLNRPTLRSIAALTLVGPYLTNSGKFLDASAIFGGTVRLAQAIGLHRDPSQLGSPVSSKEESIRRSLWWWMLQMDQQYSTALNRPLAISNLGDCPSPESESADLVIQSLSNYDSHFTLLGRQILSSTPWSNPQIDKYSDDLLALQRTIPSHLQFDVSWLNEDKQLPSWPLEVQAGLLHCKLHNLLILLNRQRVENDRNENHRYMRASANAGHATRGRQRVLQSCRSLLLAFECFTTRARVGLMCWELGQMAFNAAMILTLSMLETGETQDLMPVQQVYSAFLEMNKLGIHKLAGAAVDRLGNLMKEFRTQDSTKQTVMGQEGMILLEDPGSTLSLTEDLPRLQERLAGALSRPDIDFSASSEGPPPAKKRAARKAPARDPKSNQGKAGRRSSMMVSKPVQRPVDRRMSDSVTPRPAQRRRLDRSPPNLSVMTNHPGQGVFSANSTPTVKSEANLFTPQTFNNYPSNMYSGSPTQGQHPDMRLPLDPINPPLQAQHPQHQHSQSRLHHQTGHHQHHHDHSQHVSHHQHQPSMSDSTDAAAANDFLFGNQTTPYSSEFFDDGLVPHSVDDHTGVHPAFDHPSFATTPFSMSSDVPVSFATHFQ